MYWVCVFFEGFCFLMLTVVVDSSYIAGTNGYSNGIVPMLCAYDAIARYVDQGGQQTPSPSTSSRGTTIFSTLLTRGRITAKRNPVLGTFSTRYP
jgi:hypothetical protein